MNKTTFFYSTRKVLMLSAAFFIALSSCKKDEDKLGSDIFPDDDALSLSTTDTLALVTHSELDNDLTTASLSTSLLGSYVDPVFGLTKAGFYTQVRLSTNNVDFGTVANLEVDSVVLKLAYNGDKLYGSDDAQTFGVYEVTELMDIDEGYKADDVLTTTGTNLVKAGSETLVPDTNATYVEGSSAVIRMHLHLDKSLGERFIGQSGGATLADNDAFTNYFRGLHVVSENTAQAAGEGGIMSFSLVSDFSELTMYYRNTTEGDTTLEFDFLINDDCARFNSLEHDYTGTAIADQLADAALGQSQFYLQAGAALRASLTIPDIDTYKGRDDIAINKAELVIPVDQSDVLDFEPPNRIFGFQELTDGTLSALDDYQEGDDHVGGFYDADEGVYRLNMARHLQRYLYGSEETIDIVLVPEAKGVSANRAVLNGPDHATAPMKLELYFTNF